MKNNEGYQTTKAERTLYGVYFMGQNILWAYAGYVSTYLLDIGIDAKTASAILLGPKIWDAINDTLFGYLVDKVKQKDGQKFMPWIRLGTALVGVATILMFAIPASLKNPNFKIAWFLVAYILFDAFYTFIDAPMYAMPTVMTSNIEERTALLSYNRIWGIGGSIAGYVLIPIIRPLVGWFWGSVIICGMGVAGMVPFLFCGKERLKTENEENKEEYSLKEMVHYLVSNRYLQIALSILFIVGLSSVESQLSLLVARNCFGSEKFATIATVITTVPTVLVALIMPKLIKKYDKYYLILIGMAFGFVGAVLLKITGYKSIVVAAVLMALKSIGNSTYMVISYMLIADSVEYGTFVSGTRATGISFSLQTFVTKFKNAIIGSAILLVLGLYGYDSSLSETAVQSQSVIDGIWNVFTLIPAIGYAVSAAVLLLLYKIRDKDVELMARYNAGEEVDPDALAALRTKLKNK